MRRFRLSVLLLCNLLPGLASAAPGWVFEKATLTGEPAPGSTVNFELFDNARDAGADGAFSASR